MKTVALILCGVLAGCSHGGETARPAAPVSPEACKAAGAAFAGQPLDDALIARAKQATGRDTVRVIGPDDMVTRDYRVERLNILVDAARRVTGLACY